MGTVHIYGFTLVSGYLFYYLKIEKEKYTRFLPFVKNKAKRLLVPYAFAAIVWVIPIGFLFFRYDAATIFQNYFLAQSPSQLWFLVMLFDVFVVFWPLSRFFQKHFWGGLLVALGMYGCGVLGSAMLPNVFGIWTALQYVIFFWLGFQLRGRGSASVRKIRHWWIVIQVLLFGCREYLLAGDGAVRQVLRLGVTFLTNATGAVMAFVVLQAIADRWKCNGRVFSFLAKNSMPVYLFHQQVIYGIIWLFNGRVHPVIHGFICFAGALALSLLISAVLLKFKGTRFLVGEK